MKITVTNPHGSAEVDFLDQELEAIFDGKQMKVASYAPIGWSYPVLSIRLIRAIFPDTPVYIVMADDGYEGDLSDYAERCHFFTTEKLADADWLIAVVDVGEDLYQIAGESWDRG